MSHHSDSTVRSVSHSPSDESSFIARLLDSEPRHMPRPDYIRLCRERSVQLTSRQDCITTILEAHARFGFKPVTAYLAINYFDRFLSFRKLPDNGWPYRLLLLACLSLAAKMEEVCVPLLVELQMLERTFVFELETIQRMEVLVMDTLDWRLLSVTPFDYLHYFVSMLPSAASESDSISTVYSLASSLILKTTRVVDFLGFPPSVIAAAAVTSAAGDGVDLPDTFDERISREMVRSCHQLIDEYLLDTCPPEIPKALLIEPPAPPSPMAVLDAAACASCDTHTENLASASGSERENKRLRSSTPDVNEQP